MRGDLSIPDGGELAAQELDRRAMLLDRTLDVDDPDPCARFQCRREIVEEGIWLGDLVIHVHEDDGIQRGGRQARTLRSPQRNTKVVKFSWRYPLANLTKLTRRTTSCDDGAGGADQRREADGVIAASGADVANGHASLEFENAGDLAVFVEEVAALLAGAAWTDDRRDGTLGCRKFRRWDARPSQITDVGRAGVTCDLRRNKYHSACPYHHELASPRTMASPPC